MTHRIGRYAILTVWLLCLIFSLGSTEAGAAAKKVALLPLAGHTPPESAYLVKGVEDMLASRLASKDIVLVDPAEVDLALDKSRGKRLTTSQAAQLAKNLKADFVIYGSMAKLGDRFSLNWRILNRTDPKKPLGLARSTDENGLIDVVEEMADMARQVIAGKAPTVLVAKQEDESASAPAETPKAKPKKEKARRSLFSAPGSSGAASDGSIFAAPVESSDGAFSIARTTGAPLQMAVADLDGDKTDELITISRKSITIFSLANGRPAQIAMIRSPLSNTLYMISAGDIDKDGRDEVALSGLSGQLPESALFKYIKGRLVFISEKYTKHLRIIDGPGGSIIAGQDATIADFFVGPFTQYRLSGKKLIRIRKIPGYREILFPTLTMWDGNGDGAYEIVGLGVTEKLTVLNPGGAVLYRSSGFFGGTYNYLDLVIMDDPRKDEKGVVDINSGIATFDINGDGRKEILVVSNKDSAARLTTYFRNYKNGHVSVLEWSDKGAPVILYQTPVVDDYVSSCGVARMKKKNLFVMSASEPYLLGDPLDTAKGYVYSAPLDVEKNKKSKSK